MGGTLIRCEILQAIIHRDTRYVEMLVFVMGDHETVVLEPAQIFDNKQHL